MRKYTGIFILISLVIWFIYDLVAISSDGREASISHYVIKYSYDYPMVPFLVGFVMGHLFWRMRRVEGLEQKK